MLNVVQIYTEIHKIFFLFVPQWTLSMNAFNLNI